MTTQTRSSIIGWIREDRTPFQDAPMFIIGEEDPSDAWGIKYVPLTSALAAYEQEPVAVPERAEYGDAYQGAREDLAIWKRRALEAERQKRDLVMMVKLLARTVRKYNPESQQAEDFLAYLQCEGLISTSDILREGAKDPE